MKLLVTLFFFAFVSSLVADPSPPPAGTRAKLVALKSPRPDYPDSLRTQHKGGAGVFLLHVDDETGLVTSVDIQKSTGLPQLDQNSIATFRDWRFKPHTVPFKRVKIPITFDPNEKIPIIGTKH